MKLFASPYLQREGMLSLEPQEIGLSVVQSCMQQTDHVPLWYPQILHQGDKTLASEQFVFDESHVLESTLGLLFYLDEFMEL